MEEVMTHYGVVSTVESVQLDAVGVVSTVESVQLDAVGAGMEDAEGGSFVLTIVQDVKQ
jgi:predicted transcriptional regulator